ncbi:outer membrane protein assembly factor BamA [Moraxella sp. FZLJ2107]|uniref:outer membrane protein assembly factor BamA n=1 Tax=unclassified Moraxella TaxID=2685852 RepID=UPI0020C89C04|nr:MULTISPECIES: outer membrane protein assembly factor BamA [unclassified Moraxella]UTO05169.1 outer membrane protein assembly factor BamA [Moraxella sp. FZLJ2107]UTO21904.1 outer membrane protein assembly factor BamA [Moraxella sp. FZLJ2109]
MRSSYFSGFAKTAIATAVVMVMSAQAKADFVANDIAIDGLQRVTIESLQTTLPIRMGQTVTDEQLAQSIRALYATGNFSDVQADVNGDQVVFRVTERPTIAELNFDGNRLIPKDALEQGLKSSGLVVGGVLKQATIHAIKNELENQYASQGYYNTEINVKQTELDGNRVKLDLEFVEGKRARVVDINIIGNEHFSDDDLRQEFILKDGSWNPLSRSDRYTQEKMAASIEKLRAKYLNDGFVRFTINDANLNIDEEKEKVFIEVAVTEGEQYKFGKASFAGETTYPISELNELVAFKEGDTYSQAKMDETSTAIANKFGDDGYYYAQIRPVSRINDATRTVDIDYYVDPVRPVYVRRINFSGNHKTKDEVLRREMRQLEGALASNQKIQLSRARLLRTGFFKNVVVDTQPVPNSPDQIDVNFVVEEQPSGSSTIAAGYSQSGGMTFQFDVSQNNFMGTGNRVSAGLSRSETRDSYNLSMTDPYFTVNGVSQTIGAYYRKTKYDTRNLSNYVIDAFGGNLTYSYPIDENQRISGGINLDSVKVQGSNQMGLSNAYDLIVDDGNVKRNANGYSETFDNKYNTYNGLIGWNYSSLDRPVFPTEGQSHSVDLTLGFGDKNYQKVVYNGNYYHPFIKGSILRGYAKLGYGHNLPFYENFYAGGYGSVRGFDQSSLGPLSQTVGNIEAAAVGVNNADNSAENRALAQSILDGNSNFRGQEVGGNALATFGAELILPMPFKGDWADQVRPVVFVEGGQVFDTTDHKDQVIDLKTINPNLTGQAKLMRSDNELRYSAGVGVTWYTAIGPISISYAKPLNAKEYDETDNIQFQIGSIF